MSAILMRFRFRGTPSARWLMLLLLSICCNCRAQPEALTGLWYEAPPTWAYAGQPDLGGAGLTSVGKLSKTGGRYFYQARFEIVQPEPMVLDFKNSSVIGRFTHRVFDDSGHLVLTEAGGIQSDAANPFLLRHGRELNLRPGHYRLVTEVDSPFFLAQPAPYLDTLVHYRRAIRFGNALTLLCLGVLLGLAFYYIALSLIRRNLTDALYCAFIVGNLLYNGTALLIYPEFFDFHWFYLISVPILFSNCAYIFFVIRLLNITPDKHPRLYRTGMALLAVFVCFIAAAYIEPNWSLEFDRIGVGLFMTYGLAMGIVRARQGDGTARFYLVAVLVFFALGVVSISLSEVSGLYTLYVEHLGLLAVTIEALLLALVIASQFAQMRRQIEREHEFATRDELTGLQNRRAFLEAAMFEVERAQRHDHPLSVVFLDLDNFKQLNDSKGHNVGDAALRAISSALQGTLRSTDILGRLGGDEFSIILIEIAYEDVQVAGQKIFETVRQTLQDFPPVSVSIGVTWFNRIDRSFSDMMKAADDLMYEVKGSGKDNICFRRFDATGTVLPLKRTGAAAQK